MKKIIILCALAFSSIIVNAQGFPKPEFKITSTNAERAWGRWVSNDDAIIKMERLSPVAIKEVIDETKKLLELINADYDSPMIDKSVYYMDKTEDDISMFYVNASINFSKITKAWKGIYKGKSYTIMLSTTDDSVAIAYGVAE